MKLDTTKVYYLGDLSNEQLNKLIKHLRNNTTHDMVFQLDRRLIKDSIKIKGSVLATNKDCKTWGLYPKYYWGRYLTNALTLFTQTKDERIAQIQLCIQELNNELIELDEEMRKLTYDKKEN